MPKKIPDDDITESKNFLYLEQREVLNVVYTWVKDYVNYNWNKVEPVRIFQSDSWGTSKSHLGKVIHNVIEKPWFIIAETLKNLEFLLLGSTGISAVNIGRANVHFGPGIKVTMFKWRIESCFKK